jgi:hypothetical protein
LIKHFPSCGEHHQGFQDRCLDAIKANDPGRRSVLAGIA